MSQTLSTTALLAFLAAPEPASSSSAPAAQVTAYEDAAAVLAAIARPGQFQPLGGGPAGDAAAVLGERLIPATGRRFEGRVMLAPEIRAVAIRRLAQRGEIRAALAANPVEQPGPVQAQLERYLLGTAAGLERQTLVELEATLQVSTWLHGVLPDIPARALVERRAAFLRLLAPFEAIAGDAVFRGRGRELARLRRFAGVPASPVRGRAGVAAPAGASGKAPTGTPEAATAPAGASGSAEDLAGAIDPARWGRPGRAAALSIHGPGGVGKSALVARFMLKHANLPEEDRIPFAYLDFDRAGVDIADPYGLVVEMARQLDAQFSGDRFAGIRAFAEERRARIRGGDPAARYDAAQSLLADVLGLMGSVLGPRPYVVVLDTFEEVQFRGEARAFPFWEMLDRLQGRWPFLRVVISGRAPVETLRLAGRPPRQMLLGELDAAAAVAFLRAQGIESTALARRLVGQYGGVPLSLKLVATLLARDPAALRDDAGPGSGSTFLDASNEVIQGQLYERVLDHIDDERVRRLAHPGLVLRRVTPPLILDVLNGPCELGLTTLDEATVLFEALRRETSLVSVDDTDEALVHRSDLRRVMLKLLVASEPARVERIRRAAVAYYDREEGRRAVAEATYHRLHLGDWVDGSVLKDPEIRLSIQTAVMEYPAEVQLWLSTFGFQVPDDVRRDASLEQQEAAAAAQIEEYLPNGPASEREAQRILASMPLDMDHASPLFRAAARVAMQTGDPEGAARWIERGLARSALANATLMTLRLLQEKAWLEVTAHAPAAYGTLRQLASYAGRHENTTAVLQHRLHAFDMATSRKKRDLDVLATLLRQGTPADIWALAPALHRVVTEALRREAQPLLEVLQQHVLDPAGPFRAAGFADPGLQGRLDDVLVADAGPWKFGRAFRDLLGAWPYRILFVDPPLARRGDELMESAL